MAVSDNLGLYLPDREDYISVQRDLKSNYEIIDEHAGMVEDGIAIVINGDTAPRTITSGQYLLIKNHSTLATGGYHATANIASGASVTSSNVSPDSDGIANALNSKISNRTQFFARTSSGSDRNAVLHTWISETGIRSSLELGEIACMTGLFENTMYYGVIAKVTTNVIMGHLFTPNSASGFYFRDSSTDATASSTNFTL